MGPPGTRLMYERWRDASPSKPFPFQYGDIKYTWADVRNGLARDMALPSMIFNMGHITPGVTQVHVMNDLIRKEAVSKRKSATAAKLRTLRPTPEVPHPVESLSSTQPNVRAGTAVRTNEDRHLLYESEGAGRGRLEYLRRRRALPPEARYGIPLLSSHNFGWEVDRIQGLSKAHRSASTGDPMQAREVELEMERVKRCYQTSVDENKDFRRRAGSTAWLRPQGINLGGSSLDPIRDGYVTFPPCK